jgi:hypothetical protein
MSVLMQRTESRELGAGTDPMSSPVVPLQILQQRNALFEPFEVLAHGVPQFYQRQGMNLGPLIPGEDGRRARKKLIFRDAVARARRLAGRDRRLAKTGATNRKCTPRRGPSIAPQLAAWDIERRRRAEKNPGCETSGAGWRGRERDEDF